MLATLEEIESAIEALPDDHFSKLERWMSERRHRGASRTISNDELKALQQAASQWIDRPAFGSDAVAVLQNLLDKQQKSGGSL